ncbi:hypothetical protein [Streptomyces sp. AB3(2024)]|uniref:hypothetical protein n=1 Tax=Streptomyces sp. AB3(2024) TaxID=3317321 RepID=UPI0035A396C4
MPEDDGPAGGEFGARPAGPRWLETVRGVDRTLRIADRLYEHGVIADPIFHPAVEEGLSRLRFFVTSDHRAGDSRRAVPVLAQEVAAAGG